MDVVLRTPNGEAEVSLGPGHEDVVVGDLVERVTGRPPNQMVFVDGRAVPASTSLGTCGLLEGSTIATMDDTVAPPSDGRVELVQVAGQGAATRRWLATGRYRIGIGRRVSAPELDDAPVDTPMLVLDVDAAGAVTVSAAATPARLDGVNLDREQPTPWTTGLVDVAGRVFELGHRDPRSTPMGGHRFGGVGHDGTAAFNRPPRQAAVPDPPPLDVPDGAPDDRRARRVSAPRRGASELDATSPTDQAAVAAFSSLAAQRHREERIRRRSAHPDLARAAQLAESAAPELWQRRPGHADVFQIPIGLADVDWSPELARGQRALAQAQTIVNGLGALPLVPVTVDLLTERGVGFVGGSDFTRSITRGLLIEAAVTHGPADLDVVVLTSRDRAAGWEWVKWLPHARAAGSARILSTADQVNGWAAAVRRGWERPSRPTSPTHLTIVVVDEPAWWRERSAPLRPLLSDASMPLRFVALTDVAADVPAVCTTVVTEHADRGATVDFLMQRRRVDALHGFLASEAVAQRVARRLAPLDDPDVPLAPASRLPTSVPILPLLGLHDPSPGDLVERWGRRPDAGMPFTIGVSERGPFRLDLVEDGPHALVAGMVGSGRSELLRGLVIGLATELAPDDVNFVLVDCTGRSTFAGCADLPHTVAMVTDPNEHLTTRFIRCLRAELRHREHVLRAADVSSLDEYHNLQRADPLPRLVLVVDEFASLAEVLPEFVPSLVDIGRLGRRLGIHLVLATQWPAGVVDDTIMATTDLRIALRLADDGDSLAVIGTKAAARLPRRVPGRAYALVGTDAPTLFQAAHSSGVTGEDSPTGAGPDTILDVTPYVVVRELAALETRLLRRSAADESAVDTPSDLARLADTIIDAAEQVGQSEQRRLCPSPLADHVELRAFLSAHPGDDIPFALVDLPDEQRQAPAWWSPGVDGNLLVSGAAGAGTSSLLVTLMLGVAQRCSPDDVHVYGIDADTNLLAPLEALPHVGAVVHLDEPDRIARLVAHLIVVLDHRRGSALDGAGPNAVGAPQPRVVLMIDDVGSLRRQLEERRDLEEVWPELERVIREGPALGICVVVTAKDERTISASLAAEFPTQLVMRPDEPVGSSAVGLTAAQISEFVPGRAVRRADTSELQVAEPPADLVDAVAHLGVEPARERPVARIDPLPASVAVDDVVAAASRSARDLAVPVGLDTRTAEPALCVVPFGEAAFVVGAPGTGRSSVLAAFAAACRLAAPDIAVFGVAPLGGPLASAPGVDRPSEPSAVSAWVDRIDAAVRPCVVLVDDADRVGGPSFERLAARRDADLIVVVAGRGSDLRNPAHWSRPLQRFRHGVLLQPSPTDGDIVRVSLGPHLANLGAHRGVLVVDGTQTPLLAVTAVGAAADEGGR